MPNLKSSHYRLYFSKQSRCANILCKSNHFIYHPKFNPWNNNNNSNKSLPHFWFLNYPIKSFVPQSKNHKLTNKIHHGSSSKTHKTQCNVSSSVSLNFIFFFFVFFPLILWAWLVLLLSLVFVWNHFKWLWVFVQNPEWFIEELFFPWILTILDQIRKCNQQKDEQKEIESSLIFFGRLQQRESRSWSYWHWWA